LLPPFLFSNLKTVLFILLLVIAGKSLIQGISFTSSRQVIREIYSKLYPGMAFLNQT